ncbi:MAG: hypothetical protein Q8R55_06525 [Candidatus Taylorbacteria bacterium]|nr:hypothetical protein [Candidatus Taylorbacteria bacterium]
MDPVPNEQISRMGLSWKKYKLPIAILVLAILLIVIFMLNKGVKLLSLPVPTPTPTPVPAEGLGSEIYKEVSNPTEGVSDANPFDAKVNPYKDTYKNPFE